MSITNERELNSSIAKLAILEGDVQRSMASQPNVALRSAMQITLGRLINQFKEEIGRYRAGSRVNLAARRALQTQEEATNTRRKLAALESLLERKPAEAGADRASRSSLRRMRNELKEQLLSYEARSRQLTTPQR